MGVVLSITIPITIALIVGVIVFVATCRLIDKFVSEGYEDGEGFHYGEKKKKN